MNKTIHRALAVLLALLMLLSASAAITAAGAENDITSAFTDPSFKAAVYQIIGKDAAEDPIYDTDVAGVTELNLYNAGVQNLNGLEYFTSLIILNCSMNSKITVLPPLPATLGSLFCHNCMLTQLPPLPSGLKRLDCSSNKLTGLDVAGCTKLEFLDCSSNSIPSFDVASSPNLTFVICSNNRLASPALVNGLPALMGKEGVTVNYGSQKVPQRWEPVTSMWMSTAIRIGATLYAGVGPSYATPKASEIVYTIVSAGTTGAVLKDGGVYFPSKGTATVKATLPKGSGEPGAAEKDRKEFSQTFEITVTEPPPPPEFTKTEYVVDFMGKVEIAVVNGEGDFRFRFSDPDVKGLQISSQDNNRSCEVTSLKRMTLFSKSPTATVYLTDRNGNLIKDAQGEIVSCTVKEQVLWWQWILYYVLFGFIWYY